MNKVKMKKKGVREMAQGLRTLVALVEALDSIPRTCIRHLTTPSSFSPREYNTLALQRNCVHTCMHIGKVFISEEKKEMKRE